MKRSDETRWWVALSFAFAAACVVVPTGLWIDPADGSAGAIDAGVDPADAADPDAAARDASAPAPDCTALQRSVVQERVPVGVEHEAAAWVAAVLALLRAAEPVPYCSGVPLQ